MGSILAEFKLQCSYPKLLTSINRFITSTVDFESKSPVGSSNKMIEGEFARERAIALNNYNFTLFVVILQKVHWVNVLIFQKDPLFTKASLFFISFVFSSKLRGFSLAIRCFHKLTSEQVN